MPAPTTQCNFDLNTTHNEVTMFLYESISPLQWGIWIACILALMAFNELARAKKWTGILLFIVAPIILTIFVWPTTSGPGTTNANWFNWVKVYSALAGCIGFMALRYFPKLVEMKWPLYFPPAILGINITEAVIREFQVSTRDAGIYDGMWQMGGAWNIVNGVAGILNVITIVGFVGIFISKDKTKDMIWPDMIWPWIIAYDLWNFAYIYNCITDHSFYTGAALLLACTIPTFCIKRGAWLQHRAHTLALWCMAIFCFPNFHDLPGVMVAGSHNPAAFWFISLLSLVSNLGVLAYQIYRMRKTKINPYKGEIYKGTNAYDKVMAEN